MKIRRFEDAAEFYDHVVPFLLAHEAENNVLLGVTTTLVKTDTYQYPPYLACVEEDGAVIAVAVRTPPYNLVLSEIADLDVLPLIADDLRTVYADLPGFSVSKAVGKAFAEVWSKVSGQQYRRTHELRICRLKQVRPVRNVMGENCPATEADRDLLVEWFIAFADEALEGISREDAERQVDLRLTSDPELRGIRLWHDAGKAVSFAGYTGPTPNGMRIGPVYTPPELRGRGYASACVAALSQELLDAGRKFCFLFTDLSNPTSNSIYQNIGYEPVSHVDEYHFEAKS